MLLSSEFTQITKNVPLLAPMPISEVLPSPAATQQTSGAGTSVTALNPEVASYRGLAFEILAVLAGIILVVLGLYVIASPSSAKETAVELVTAV